VSTGHRPAATARVADCAEWNTRKFFKRATLEEVQGCLAAGAEVNARTEYGITPLHSAAGIGPLVLIELLLGAGALVNAQDAYGWTPLHNAAQLNNDPAVIRALVSAGAEVNAQDESGWTPLHWAAQSTDNPAIVPRHVKQDLRVRVDELKLRHGSGDGDRLCQVVDDVRAVVTQ